MQIVTREYIQIDKCMYVCMHAYIRTYVTYVHDMKMHSHMYFLVFKCAPMLVFESLYNAYLRTTFS